MAEFTPVPVERGTPRQGGSTAAGGRARPAGVLRWGVALVVVALVACLIPARRANVSASHKPSIMMARLRFIASLSAAAFRGSAAMSRRFSDTSSSSGSTAATRSPDPPR